PGDHAWQSLGGQPPGRRAIRRPALAVQGDALSFAGGAARQLPRSAEHRRRGRSWRGDGAVAKEPAVVGGGSASRVDRFRARPRDCRQLPASGEAAMSLAALNDKLAQGSLAPDEIEAAFGEIMDGLAAHEEIKRFLLLTIPHMREPDWIAGGARSLSARMIGVAAPEGAIDVCGTGGDGAHTLNISTAVALVAAGCGVPVAKHGNRAMSCKSGAADVLEALGVVLTGEVAWLERCLREAGVAFLFAQNHHPAMRHVALARRELGQRTIFNLLVPLSNPAGVKRQLIGVFSADFLEPVAQALARLGGEKAWVVHGAGGLDELSAQDREANTVAV